MLSYIARRLAAGVVLLVAITTVAFLLLYAGGGNIARRIVGQSATEEVVARKAAELGLDKPLWEQYWNWLTGAVHGDFGRSWFSGETVVAGLTSRLAVTLALVCLTTLIAALLAVVLGVLAATRRGWIDKVVQFGSVLGFAIPGFLIALALVVVFSINLGWFRATGFIRPSDSVSGWLKSITLPVIALAVGSIASVAQQVRGAVLDALSRDYVRTLRSRGVPSRRVVYKHVLRNAGGPALAVLGVNFIGMLGGTVIVERMFLLPGLGQLAVNATTQADIPYVMGLVLATAVIVVVVNLVIDLAQAALNPRVRLS
ncbi:MAG: ABC transporter permease [Bifidobacteriaceae bacterium]|jgi:peptide/nickel transport system permease protein|nr:ABC transporter permease [Bifidobacteriaceae bacterium]